MGKALRPAIVKPPSDALVREVIARGWSLKQLSIESGLSIEKLSGPFQIDKEMAEGLSKAFGTSVDFWLNLQSQYDRWLLEKHLFDKRTVDAAFQISGLTEEEAYFILRFAGEIGYDKAIARLKHPLKRIRKWFIWIGGWEASELTQWDRGRKAWEPRTGGKWNNPTPVSLFGHLVTFFDTWLRCRCFNGSLVITYPWAKKEDGPRVYWSPNGTPSHAKSRTFWS